MKPFDAAPKDRRRYRRVLTRMWGDEKFCELSKPKPNAQSLWQFLICGTFTGPIPGLFSAGEFALAEALEWPIGQFRKKWNEIADKGMAKADWRRRVVWLPRAIVHNEPESPNVVTSWRTALDEIPECALKTEAVESLKAFLVRKGPAFSDAFAKAIGDKPPHPLANQEQEQEQEQESSGKGKPSPVSLALRHYHDGYLRRFSEKPLINGPKDGAIVKRLVGSYGSDVVHARIDRLLDSTDPFIVNSGRTIGVLQACWNKLTDARQVKTPRAMCQGRHVPPCADDAECTRRRVSEQQRGVRA